MNGEYGENMAVRDAAGDFLRDELGWEVKFAFNKEDLGVDGMLGRTKYREVLLRRYFREALRKFNPWMDESQMDEAQKAMESRASTASAMQINEEKYFLIRDGIPVTEKKPDGSIETRTAQVIDFEHPQENHFLAVKELKVDGEIYHRRADIVGFVNGIPLLFMELKAPGVDVQNAYTDNYTDYQDTVPQLFYYNAFVMLSNGEEAKVGTLGSKYEFFHEWKRLAEEDEGSVELETMLRGICRKENFLDLFENFILFDHSQGKNVKILARNHQYLGVNAAVKAYEEREIRGGKLGVFWHTQGSGKSYSMVFLAQKIRRKFKGSPTFVILTDRDELNKQISDTFENCGLLGKSKASQFTATSWENLNNRLTGNPSFIFTLIQKFNKKKVTPIYPDHDIIIMSDEAHRSQNGIFADNMMALLPTASRIGFTGTPIFANDNITERTFGGYVSIYDFQRAVDDGATVPLYYENRGDKIANLEQPEITDEILDAIDAADLDPDQEEKLEQEFKKEIHILTAEKRLRAIAKDFAGHYSDLWTSGKAMFVCLNKVTCVRMYNFVQEYWQEEIEKLEKQIKSATQQEAQELERKLQWMKETEMAVVISQEQNEIQTFKKWGLDILPHREKMEKRELDKEFKDDSSNFRVVFVCAMWLTGFDVKSLSCLYLDKPMKAHALMQAIARANRVSEGKSNGLIIDYVGVVKALRKALADYTINGSGAGSANPMYDKEKLIARVHEIIEKTDAYLAEHGFALRELVEAKEFRKIKLLRDGANAMCESPEVKRTFQAYAAELHRLMKYVNHDDVDEKTHAYKNAIIAIRGELQKKKKHVDNTDIIVQINGIIDEHIWIENQDNVNADDNAVVLSRQFDISKIDFDLLAKEFARTKNKNLVMKDLEDLIHIQLEKMMKVNPGRSNYYDRYQEIINDYNEQQDRAMIEKTFMDLMKFTSDLNDEQKRYVREGFSDDEELAVYELLLGDKEDLSKQDIEKIKKVAVDLLAKVKAKIAELDHWTEKAETTETVNNLIRNVLWEQLPESYDNTAIDAYRERICEYVYTHYRDVA
ncbi:MAG: type I restriction endonuclease subunit R [Clostridiales bacterium]|nr:type I restriction endonuclease subunit R [Clostridiales bacterium]